MPTTLYAADYEVDLFKSTDGGATWRARNNGILDDRGFTGRILIDSMTPETLYAETGSIYKSTDGGDSWSSIFNPTGSNPVLLAIGPTAPTTLFAGTASSGSFKSTDGGANWTATGLTSTFVQAFAIHPVYETSLYAGTAGAGLFIKTEGSGWQGQFSVMPLCCGRPADSNDDIRGDSWRWRLSSGPALLAARRSAHFVFGYRPTRILAHIHYHVLLFESADGRK
jgi:hypothetical protein